MKMLVNTEINEFSKTTPQQQLQTHSRKISYDFQVQEKNKIQRPFWAFLSSMCCFYEILYLNKNQVF